MESVIARALKLSTNPIALCFADEKPAGAVQFEPGRWGCVMAMFGAVATQGKSAAFDRESYGCFGGGYGLGFGNTYQHFPGGIAGFCRFLSTGNQESPDGSQVGEGMRAAGARPEFVHHFLHGERYKKTPELVEAFLDALPVTEVPTRYVVFKPLAEVDRSREEPVSVSFLVSPDQLAALVVLANYDRPGLENVAIPYVAACQTIGILSYREARSETPRGLVGLMDLSARRYLRGVAGRDAMTFTVPFGRFLEMERNVPGSFLEGDVWQALAAPERGK